MCFDANLSYKSYFEVGENTLIPKLKKKLGTLKLLGHKVPVQQRKKLANGVIMSRILYRIAVWGNMVSKTQLERIQTVQTLTMRWIVGDQYWKDNGRYLNRNELLEKAG